MDSNEQELENLKTSYLDNRYDMVALLEYAEGCIDRGKLNRAVEVLEKEWDKWKNSVSYLILYGNLAFKKGNCAKAMELFQRATEVKPDDVSAWNNLGYVMLSQDKSEEAVYAFKRVLDIEPDNHGTLLNLGNCYENTGEPDRAFDCFREAVDLKPDFYEGWFNLGNQYLARREYESAVSAYKRALKYEPESSSARKNIGVAYMNSGDIDAAINNFYAAVESNPADAGAYVNLSSIYIKKRLYKKAKEYLLKAVKISPRNQNGWFGLREVALRQGDIQSFFDSTVRLINRIEPDDIAETLYILRSTDNLDKGKKLIRIVDKAGIDSVSLASEKMIYRLMSEGRGKESEEMFSEIRKARDSWTKIRAAEYAWYTGRIKEAKGIFEGVMEDDAFKDIYYRSIYWKALIKSGSFEKALQSIYSHLEAEPDSSQALFSLALLYAERGDRGKALKYLKRAMSEGLPDMDELFSENWALKGIYDELSGT